MTEKYLPDIAMPPEQRRKIVGVGKIDRIEVPVADVTGRMVQEQTDLTTFTEPVLQPVQSIAV